MRCELCNKNFNPADVRKVNRKWICYDCYMALDDTHISIEFFLPGTIQEADDDR